MGIKHRAYSGFRKFSALNKFGFGWTGKCFYFPAIAKPFSVGGNFTEPNPNSTKI